MSNPQWNFVAVDKQIYVELKFARTSCLCTYFSAWENHTKWIRVLNHGILPYYWSRIFCPGLLGPTKLAWLIYTVTQTLRSNQALFRVTINLAYHQGRNHMLRCFCDLAPDIYCGSEMSCLHIFVIWV